MAGTQSVWADDPRILGIPRSRQTVAIIYPQYGSGLQGFPPPSGQASTERRGSTPSLSQCSARAAQDIWEHHRPAVGSSMLALGGGHSASEEVGYRGPLGWPGVRPSAPRAGWGCPTQAPGARGRGQNPTPRMAVRDRCQWEVDISLVIGINQTNHSTNQERPCTTIRRIKKELSICPSRQRPDLVTFPVLSQIKPHTPHLVVPFRQFL